MARACEATSGDRREAGELLMLCQATMDDIDVMGRLTPDRYSVTVKLLRSSGGQIVASTRITTPDDPESTQPALRAAAQQLADRIIARVRFHLTGAATMPDATDVAAGAGAH